jgi:hypothetical protein
MPVYLKVTDANGRIVYNRTIPAKQLLAIDTRHWMPGMYILEIRNEKSEVINTQKIIKQ